MYNERPQGTGSCIGESFNDFMTPVKAKIGGASSLMNSPRAQNDLTGGSDKQKHKKINQALIQKAMKNSPMTEKAHKPSSKKKPSFNFNLGGNIPEKASEDSHSTQLKKDKEDDDISFDLNVEEINIS